MPRWTDGDPWDDDAAAACSSGCPAPPEPGRLAVAYWAVRAWVTWPWQARQLKAAGFTRLGWMTWGSGPAGDDPWPADWPPPPDGEPPANSVTVVMPLDSPNARIALGQDPGCYRSVMGIMVHGPGCTCPP